MSVTLYGIPNCDTVKKARTWLESRGVSYAFHDYKKAGAEAARLGRWCDELGWEVILNRSGTTFKKLDPSEKEGLNQQQAIMLMLSQPSMIKRPVVEYDGGLLVGFKATDWEVAFDK
jgi:arsenate reductase